MLKYTVNDLVVMRSPLYSIQLIDLFNDLVDTDFDLNNMKLLLPEFLEGIAVANLKFFHLVNKHKDSLNDGERETLLKYLNRIIIRPTPFALFSGISICEFGNKTEIQRNSISKYRKKCNVDYVWFYSLIKRIENKINILKRCEIKFNNQCYIMKNRIVNPYISNYGQKKDVDGNYNLKSDIILNKQTKFIYNSTKNWITYENLVEKIREYNNDDFEIDIIEKFINKLIENEYLITKLRVPLSSLDPLELLYKYLTEILDKDEVLEELENIENIINLKEKYEKAEIGSGIELYLELCNQMKKLGRADNYLCINTNINLKSNRINKDIKRDIEDLLDFAVAISTSDNETPHIKEYKKRFLEKYGEDTEIKVTDLIDETLGLGNLYTNNISHNIFTNTKKMLNIQKHIDEKIQYALIKDEDVVLTEDDKDDFNKLEDRKQNYSNSFELNIKILAKNEKDIDKGLYKIILAPSPGSSKLGSFINRYYNVMNKSEKEKVRILYSYDMNNSIKTVTSSFLPKAGNINNICNGNLNYSQSLDLGLDSEASNLDIEELVIGYNNFYDRLYIRNKETNEILNVVSDNMLNKRVDNILLRLLWEISYSYYINPVEQLMNITSSKYKYTPLIKYKNIILSPETWRIEENDFESIDDYESFYREFLIFKKKWGVPNSVYIYMHDRFLYFNLSSKKSIEYIFNEAKKLFKNNMSLVIQEAIDSNYMWVSDIESKKYNSEFIIQCIKNESNNLTLQKEDISSCKFTSSDINQNKVLLNSKDRELYLGEKGWVYYNIYISNNKVNEFIYNEIDNFVRNMYDEKLISEMFFIRYSDPEFHIRFRVKSNTESINYKLFDKLQVWLKHHYENGNIISYSNEVYEREINRYGGEKLIEYAEKVFEIDSKCVFIILRLFDKCPEEVLLSISLIFIYNIFNIFLGDKMEVEKYLDKYVSKKEFRKEYQKYRKIFLKALDNPEVFISNLSNELYENYIRRNKIISEYYKRMKEVDKNNELTNTISRIAMTFSHMFCNRVNGNRIWERQLLALTRHTVHDYIQKERNIINNK